MCLCFEPTSLSKKQCLETLEKIISPKIGRNENFFMQMAYGDKKLFIIFFIYYGKIWLPSWNASRKGGFVIFFKRPDQQDFEI